MLGQSKTVQQAEIDSACEVIDFFRFNATFATELAEQQPISSAGVWNRLELRPLDGFVFAISPFNFTAIGANLPTAPALMGNTVVWKPASTAVVSAHRTMRLLQAAGLPDGVINLVPGDAAAVSGTCLAHPDFAGLHFTGSTEVFQNIWREVGQRIASYRSYPRIVGETGGKNFVVVHHSAEPQAVADRPRARCLRVPGPEVLGRVARVHPAVALGRSVHEGVAEQVARIKVGDVADFGELHGGGHRRARRSGGSTTPSHRARERRRRGAAGGGCDDSEGWFIEPTLVRRATRASIHAAASCSDRCSGARLPDDRYAETSNCAMHVAVRAHGRRLRTRPRRRSTTPTAAPLRRRQLLRQRQADGRVVGQQPFGGPRASGTNDKAGSLLNLVAGSRPHGQGDVSPPTDFSLSVPRRGLIPPPPDDWSGHLRVGRGARGDSRADGGPRDRRRRSSRARRGGDPRRVDARRGRTPFTKAGIAVLVERCGAGAGFDDASYRAAAPRSPATRRRSTSPAAGDRTRRPPDTDELALLRNGTVVLGLFAPLGATISRLRSPRAG